MKIKVATGFDVKSNSEVIEEVNLTQDQAKSIIQRHFDKMNYTQAKAAVDIINGLQEIKELSPEPA